MRGFLKPASIARQARREQLRQQYRRNAEKLRGEARMRRNGGDTRAARQLLRMAREQDRLSRVI